MMTFFFQKTVDCSKSTKRCEQLSFRGARDCSKITPVQKHKQLQNGAFLSRMRLF